MSKVGVSYIDDCIDAAIDYCRVEFDITFGEIVGVLEIYKAKIIREAIESENPVSDWDSDDIETQSG